MKTSRIIKNSLPVLKNIALLNFNKGKRYIHNDRAQNYGRGIHDHGRAHNYLRFGAVYHKTRMLLKKMNF